MSRTLPNKVPAEEAKMGKTPPQKEAEYREDDREKEIGKKEEEVGSQAEDIGRKTVDLRGLAGYGALREHTRESTREAKAVRAL